MGQELFLQSRTPANSSSPSSACSTAAAADRLAAIAATTAAPLATTHLRRPSGPPAKQHQQNFKQKEMVC